MATYAITGVTKGLGFAFLRHVSSDPNNTVIGLVRDPASVQKKVSAELPERTNIHIVRGDLGDFDSFKAAAKEVAAITGGSLDYLIANAAMQSTVDGYTPIADTPSDIATETFRQSFDVNVIGNMHLFREFVPLLKKGRARKVLVLTTGMADAEFVNDYDIGMGSSYAASKAALNLVVAKFNVQYKKDGVLFLGVSPGVVDTGNFDPSTLRPEQLQGMQEMMERFAGYAPHFKGPIPAEESVNMVMKVLEEASLEKGYGGAFISHLGTKKWL